MEGHSDFESIFNSFTPERDEDIDNLDLVKKNRAPKAAECTMDDWEEKIQVETTEHQFGVVTFATWFSKYSNLLSSVKKVDVKISSVDPNETIVVTVPNEQGKKIKGNDRRHLKMIENASIIPVIDARPIDMFMYVNGYQILYAIGGNVYLKGYSVRKKFIVNVCLDILDYFIPTHQFVVKRGDSECKFKSYALEDIIEDRIVRNLLDREKLSILYHQSKKFKFSNFNELLKCLTERQGGIKEVGHQLEIDTAIEKLCLDGVEYEA